MPAPSKELVPVPLLREALRARVESSSLRKSAREVGLSPNGLRGILEGADPYPTNHRKLSEWFRGLRSEAERGRAILVQAALNVLVDELPENERERKAVELLTVLRSRRS